MTRNIFHKQSVKMDRYTIINNLTIQFHCLPNCTARTIKWLNNDNMSHEANRIFNYVNQTKQLIKDYNLDGAGIELKPALVSNDNFGFGFSFGLYVQYKNSDQIDHYDITQWYETPRDMSSFDQGMVDRYIKFMGMRFRNGIVRRPGVDMDKINQAFTKWKLLMKR
ncbi:hypothetical protein [Gluconacetobacter diazotrophicus]|uniref:hypothetical protein n=1 Tax=Gluconacetobacter diazotrophicus TaxID=33996 RepID=UPI0011A70C6E|nr:hypothetical protein [Gluconacetobacter diazotrophicus]